MDENNNIIGTEDYDFVLRLMLKVKRAVLIKKSTLALLDYMMEDLFLMIKNLKY